MLNRVRVGLATATLFISAILLGKAYSLDMQSHLLYGLFSGLIALFFIFQKSEANTKFTLSDSFIVAFYLVFLLSILFSQHPFGFIELITFSLGILVYFLLAKSKLTLPKLKVGFFALVSITTLFSVYGLIDFIVSPENRLAGLFQGDNSYSSYPNAMGDLLIFTLPIIFVFFTKFKFHQNKFKKILCGFLLSVNLIGLILTFSRGSILSLVFVILVAGILFMYHHKKIQGLKYHALAVGIVLVISIISAFYLNLHNTNNYQIVDRLTNQDISSYQSTNERVAFWKGAIEITKDNPLLGVGPGGFVYAYPRYQTEMLVLSDHPHNLLLKISAESGLFAAVFFTVFLIITFVRALLIIPQAKHQLYFIAILLGCLGVTVHSLIDYNLNFTLISGLFFAGLGLIKNEYFNKQAELSIIIKSQLYCIAVLIVSLGLFVVTILQTYGFWHYKIASDTTLSKDQVEKHISKALVAPFKGNIYELISSYNLIFDTKIYSQKLSLAFTKYSKYHPLQYYYAELNPDSKNLHKLLSLDSKNNLKYYLLYLQSLSTDSLAMESDHILEILKEYTYKLSVNMHHTVVTDNPYFAEQIFDLYLDFWSNNDQDIFEVWLASQQDFRKIWADENQKFNQRYNTNLSLKLLQ